MKIIGKTKNGWLLDVDQTELAILHKISTTGNKVKLPEIGQRYEINTSNILSPNKNLILKKQTTNK